MTKITTLQPRYNTAHRVQIPLYCRCHLSSQIFAHCPPADVNVTRLVNTISPDKINVKLKDVLCVMMTVSNLQN